MDLTNGEAHPQISDRVPRQRAQVSTNVRRGLEVVRDGVGRGGRWARAHLPKGSRRALIGAVSIFIALTSWALSTAVGGTPDEDYHVVSIWCTRVECLPAPAPNERYVPAELLTKACYAFDQQESAACQDELPSTGMALTHRGNFNGDYPPVFYGFAGIFVGDDVDRSVIVMRIANLVLFLGLAAAIYLLVPLGLRRPLIVGSLFTAVPTGAFLIPSINPSGWAIMSASTLFVSMLGFLTATSQRRRIALGALAGLSLLLGAGARGDAAAYAIIAIGVACLLAFRFTKRDAALLVLPGVLAVIAALAFFSAGHSAGATTTSTPTGQATGPSIKAVFLSMPEFWIGAFGQWALGWVDTHLEPMVWVTSWSVFAGVLFLAIGRAGPRRAIAIGLVGSAAIAIPTYVQYSWGGVGIQPRYIFPLLVLLAAVATVRLDGEPFSLTAGQRWTVVAALSVSNALALHTNMRRYITGLDSSGLNLDRDLEWWWDIPVSPTMTWAVGSLAFAVGMALLTRDFVAPSTDGSVSRVPPTSTADAAATALAEPPQPADQPGRHRQRRVAASSS